MKKAFAAFVLTLLTGASIIAGQTEKPSTTKAAGGANAKAQAEVRPDQGGVTLDAGSQIDAEITSTLDLKKAKPGDPFKMKTTRPVKSHGKEVISRGSAITGHIDQITRANNATTATLVFDQMHDKKTHLTSSLSAVVTAVTRAERATSIAGDDSMATPTPRASQPRAQQSSSQQSGGLLGGVTQTVSGAAQTVTGVAGQAGSTVGATTSAALGSNAGLNGGLARGAIQIVSDTAANTTSGSTLALGGGNPKLESGTQFVLKTTSALTLTKEPKQK